MSVIITNMNMPKSCDDCYRDCAKRQAIWYMTDNPVLNNETAVHPDCPLKSVDGLIEKIKKIGGNEDKSVYKNLHTSYIQGLKDALNIIKEYCEVKE